ncbi:MAG: enoyl-CoA hydratase/isomerase family protein [Vulcanimicrobiota bacterium]
MAWLRMQRARARNALNSDLISQLERALGEAQSAACLVLSGAEGVFSAGADLRERAGLSAPQRTAHTRRIAALCDQLEAFPVPVAACIQGACLAGGLELALACDVRFASEDAIFGFPEVSLGIFPGADGPLRLSRLVGPGRAASLLYSARRVGFAEAREMGLVEAGPALNWARSVAANSKQAVRALKAGLRASRELPWAEASLALRQHREPLDASPEYTAALAAFKSKS